MASDLLAKKVALAKEAAAKPLPFWKDGSKPYFAVGVSTTGMMMLWLLAIVHSWSLAVRPTPGHQQGAPAFHAGEADAVAHAASSSPPEPFRYANFMAWLKRHSLDVRDFDVDRAMLTGPIAEFLQGEGSAVTAAVAKSINRWSFEPDAFRARPPPPLSSIHVHMYILRRLLAVSEVPEATFLDVGCGTGYLMAAWRLAAENGARVMGMDVDADVVADAMQRLQSSEAYDPASEPEGAIPAEAFVGSLFEPQALKLLLAPESVHAMNVGVAVEAVEDLAGLVQLLRPDGLLAAPVCSDAPVLHKGQAQCSAMLRVFKKAPSGQLQLVPDASARAEDGANGLPLEGVTVAIRTGRRHSPSQ